MSQEFLRLKRLTKKYQDDVWKLLSDADGEFIPPLSSREKTTQAALLPGKGDARGPVSYFEQMIRQAFILAVKDGRVNGFLTYIPDHVLLIDGREVTCNYISTIVVEPESRKQGLTRRMYDELFRISKGRKVATRTWSTNDAHLSLLKKMGFQLINTIPDDRGPGIDTVYYLKEIGSNE